MSTATEAPTQNQQTVTSVKLNLTNNWTGLDELPFELVAERVFEIESQGEKGPLTVSFGKPVFLEGKGWACVFKMSTLGREHISPARGVDSVDALQAAFGMVHKQLTGMRRMHTITFFDGEDLGFAPAGGEQAQSKAAGCPVMNGSMNL